VAVFGSTTRLGASARLARPEQVRGATQPQRTGTTERERSATRGEITRAIRDAVKGIEVALQVPGIHYSGLTYDHLLAILAAQGRDFDATTPAMRKHMAAEVTIAFENAVAPPTAKALKAALAESALGWIVRRFSGRVRDEHLTSLTIPYAREKRKSGYGRNPIGVRTGALAARVEAFGKIKLK
jgi:hypothetical protein